jgi:hypothetical protein
MAIQRFVYNPRFIIILIPLILFFACACTYQGDEFTFSAPFGFKTKQFVTPEEVNPNNDPESLIYSNNGHLSFWVTRQNIPKENDLESVFNAYKATTIDSFHYQFISQSIIEINDRTAIEYIYRLFSGEPYWQRREVWMENNGWAYSLVCSDPADSTPGLIIPISDLCIRLVEGFKFK